MRWQAQQQFQSMSPDQLAIDGREYGMVSDVGPSFCLLVDGREMLPIGKYIIISYTRVTLAVDRSCIKGKDTCLCGQGMD